VEQLYDLYPSQRRYKRYETWLEQQVLLPLLDGLDELGLERQKECTIKLKQFARHYPHMVICCRDKEFEAVDIPNPLRGKVYLQPLADKQIQDYLKSKNRSELWSAIQAQPDLRKLLEPTTEGDPGLFRVPLFLKLAADIYDPQQPILNKSDLLEKYIDQQLSREKREQDRRQDLENGQWAYKTVEKEPDWRQIRKTLSWVAQQLNANHSVELLIEKMQPSWLMNKCQRWQYQLFLGFAKGLVLGLFFGALIAWNFEWSYKVIAGLICGMIFGIFTEFFNKIDRIKTIDLFEFTKSSFEVNKFFQVQKNNILIWLAVGLGVFVIRGFHELLIVWLIYGPIFLLINFFKQDIIDENCAEPNQGIKTTFKNLIFLSIISLICSIIFLESVLPSRKISIIVSFAFIGSTSYIGGGKAILQHIALRLVLLLNGYAPYPFDRFLRYCVERRLLYSIGGRYSFFHRELLDHFDPSKP
jgi:hypothetical protein